MSRLAIMGALAFLIVAPAAASPIIQSGNNPQADEQNILFKTNQTGSTVVGFTNQTNTQVDFSSTTDTLNVTANGQANLTATDGVINNVKIYLDTSDQLDGFGDLIIDPHRALCSTTGLCNGQNTEQANIVIAASDGIFASTVDLSNGDNFFTILASAGEKLLSVTIDDQASDGIDYFGFEDLKQVRISGIDLVSIPEPSTMLLGITLLGLIGIRHAILT